MPGNIEISHDNKFLYVTANGTAGPEGCLAEGRRGFLIVDIRNPRNPKTIAMADTGKAFSLVAAAHPTKPYVYDAAASVTNSDGQVQSNGEIRVWNVRNPKKPAVANTVATLPISGQQISFNSDGTKMVTAAVDRFEIFDTADVENPRLLWSGRCPGCSSIRDAKFTPDDRGVIVSDSAATGGVLPLCPVGALYFYQLQGEFLPVLTGSYKPAHLLWPGNEPSLGWCTSDAFDISPDGSRVAIAWRSMGVRHLDISGMAGLAFGEESIGEIKELGWFRPDGSMVLSATFLGEGKYIVSADMNRGFDIFKAKKTGTRVTSRSSEKRRMSVAKQLTR